METSAVVAIAKGTSNGAPSQGYLKRTDGTWAYCDLAARRSGSPFAMDPPSDCQWLFHIGGYEAENDFSEATRSRYHHILSDQITFVNALDFDAESALLGDLQQSPVIPDERIRSCFFSVFRGR